MCPIDSDDNDNNEKNNSNYYNKHNTIYNFVSNNVESVCIYVCIYVQLPNLCSVICSHQPVHVSLRNLWIVDQLTREIRTGSEGFTHAGS